MSPIQALFQQDVSDRNLERGAIALQRLSGWWLTGAALERLALAPIRHADPVDGEFIVLLARTAPSSVVSDGLALPLRWTRDRRHDPRLPPELHELAERVRLATASGASQGRRLQLGDGCPDLSRLSIGAASAGAMLAATLQVAESGLALDPFVTASAEWRGGEPLRSVEGIAAKRAAAERLGLRALWVAPSQELHPLGDGFSTIHRLPGASGIDQLNALVGELDARPFATSLDAACAWYHRNRNRPGPKEREAREFYCRELAAPLARRARARDGDAGLPRRLDVLVVVATRGPSASFAAAFLKPERVFVAYAEGQDGEGERYHRATAESIAQTSDAIEIRPMPLPGVRAIGFEALRDVAASRLREAVGTGRAAIDLTGGTTLMKLALFEAAREVGLHRTIVDGSETSHAKGGHDVTTLRVVSIPHGAI